MIKLAEQRVKDLYLYWLKYDDITMFVIDNAIYASNHMHEMTFELVENKWKYTGKYFDA